MRAIVFGLALLFAAPAHAQFGLDGEMPIHVEAEKATYQGGITVLESQVRVRQNDSSVQSDRMEIYRDETENDATSLSTAGTISFGAIKRIEALGSFRFQNPENIITGNEGTYYADREIFVVTGDVKLVQPSGNTVRGNRLVYNLETQSAKFGTPCETGTAEQNACDRVTIRIE